MKRNKMNKLFVLFGAMLFFVTVFLTGAKAEEIGQEEEYPLAGQVNLSYLDWENATNETIDHYLGMSDWGVIGNWLLAMSEEEREKLLQRDTLLVCETTIEEPGEEEPLVKIFYEYAMEKATPVNPMMRAAYPTKTSGYWQTHIIKLNASGTAVNTAVITYKISGIDTSVPTAKQQGITVSKTVTGNWCDVAWSHAKEGEYTYKEKASDTNYPLARAYVNFEKPAGYKASVTYNINSGFRHIYWSPQDTFKLPSFFDGSGVLTDAERKSYPTNTTLNGICTGDFLKSETKMRHYLVSIVNIYKNAGIGTTANATQGNLIQTITFTPSTYSVNYNGNGATGGTVATQNCTYDMTYAAQSNGFTREYTVNYNGNGGTPGVLSQKAKYVFKGWGMNQAQTFSYNPGAQYKNLTAVGGGTVTMYALWNPSSVVLPDAVRKGYCFLGWNVGKAGASYTPKNDVTVTAQWQANTYTINFDSDGGSSCQSVLATYDKTVTLPEPSKAGYSFLGWNYAGANYKGSVKNLTDKAGEKLTLYAQWKVNTDTPYTVKYWRQKDKNSDASIISEENYELFEPVEGQDKQRGMQIFYGMTDEIVTVQPYQVTGYTTPAAQTVKIAGDGSTVVEFFYKLMPEEEEKEDKEENTEENTGDNSENNNHDQGKTETEEKPIENAIPSGIAKGFSVSLVIDGATYEIAQNPDGTVGIKNIFSGAAKIKIPEVVQVSGQVHRVTEIHEKAFKNNKTLKEIRLSKNITRIGASAFEGCTSLKKVTLQSGLATIGSKAFKGCTSLTSVKFPSTLQSIGNYAFENCKKLKTVTLNNGLTKIGKKAFYKCSALNKITVPKTVLKIGSYAFAKCKKLKILKFAAEAQLLDMSDGVFSECSSLVKAVLPSRLVKVPTKLFYKCSKLKSVTIGNSVNSVGSSAFRYCKKLTGVKGGKSLTKIGKYAFRDCPSLTKITLYSKVQTIGEYSFYNCKKLKKVTIKTKALTSVGSKAFKKCKKGIKFVVPKEKKKAYIKLFKGKY